MNILTAINERLCRLTTFAELNVSAADLPSSVLALGDSAVVDIATELAAIASDVSRMQAVVAGVAAYRSRRENGHSGLAATQGHASPASLIQAITGGTKADATRQVRVGIALLEEVVAAGAAGNDTVERTPLPTDIVWHTQLRNALMGGRLTTEQHDAIRRGLGEPRDESVAASEVWSVAATQLSNEAPTMTVEDLAARARAVRDALDPVGAEERYARRYENRSFRMWIDRDGQHRGSLAFDDEMALWVRSIRDAGLRPRRGGPRFMTDEERAQATELIDDPRTNEQLQYDLLMSTLLAGALAEAKDVFGARQPGVRMIVVKDAGHDDVGPRDAFGRLLTMGFAEDGGQALPGSIIDRSVCMNGVTEVTVDACGNPLDVGREQRLFGPRQRITLAVRDGGCIWPGCPMPASYCEAHHIDHFVADGGRTDIDRGVLLCRFHHLLLHNRGWKIRRHRKESFVLHPPPGEGNPMALVSKASWKWAWNPPPPPQRSGWRAA